MIRHLDLFSGIGGFALAVRWLGGRTVGFCEIEPYPRSVLAKQFPGVPIHDDIRTLTGAGVERWGGCDLITGSSAFKRGNPTLRRAAELWPTPRAAHDAGAHREVPDSLHSRVQMYPTPRPCSGERSSGMNRSEFYRLFPTPTTQDAKNNGGPSQHDRHSPPRSAVASGPLNPAWVEWLMGYPIGWTDLEDSGTPSSPALPTNCCE